MRVHHALLLFAVVLPFCLSVSPPQQRPPPRSDAGAHPRMQDDTSIIIPLYKEALKADAEGRPEDSLRLLSTPPLSLAPGILSTCFLPLTPSLYPPHPLTLLIPANPQTSNVITVMRKAHHTTTTASTCFNRCSTAPSDCSSSCGAGAMPSSSFVMPATATP
jgi:hypothetical protein